MKNWWEPRTPEEVLEYPIPWLCPEAIAHLEKLIKPDWLALEHGGGGSTLWLAERCRAVFTVEVNPDWNKALKKAAPRNVTLLDAAMPANKVDLLLIDGEPVESRIWWIEHALELVKPAGLVVLDNANRPEYASARAGLFERAAATLRINGNGDSTKYLVTDFFRLA